MAQLVGVQGQVKVAKKSQNTPTCSGPPSEPHTENEKRFFSILSRRLAESVDGLDSSLTQSPGELWPKECEPIYGLSRSLKGSCWLDGGACFSQEDAMQSVQNTCRDNRFVGSWRTWLQVSVSVVLRKPAMIFVCLDMFCLFANCPNWLTQQDFFHLPNVWRHNFKLKLNN